MFGFNIRDLLWLTMVAAVLIASLMDRIEGQAERSQAAQREALLIARQKAAEAETERVAVTAGFTLEDWRAAEASSRYRLSVTVNESPASARLLTPYLHLPPGLATISSRRITDRF